MKKTIYALLSTSIVILLSCQLAVAQQNHVITLIVNSADIVKQDSHLYCYFEDQEEGTDTRDYTVIVDVGDTITWRGISGSTAGDRIEISSINHEGGDNVFNKNVLRETRQNPGIVSGIVQQGTEGFIQKYKISFKIISSSSNNNATYHVDPKVQVKQAR